MQYQTLAKRKARQRNKALADVERGRGCYICKSKDDLDFHHRDSSAKSFTITDGIWRAVGLLRFVEELEKCVVLCRPCHVDLHKEAK